MAGIKLLLLVIICTTLTIQSVDGKVMDNINDWRNTCCPDCPAVTSLIKQNSQRYAMICQMGTEDSNPKKKSYYATFFDKKNRIPVFSVFKVSRGNCGRLSEFFYEGGLVDERINGYIYNSSKMRNLLELTNNEIKQKIMVNQAHDVDYAGQRSNILYDKGHLNPHASFCRSLGAVESTFTYTNVAPQVRGFNVGTWRSVEKALRECNDNNHMAVVGVVPSKTFLRRIENQNRVNIPSFFWAYAECRNSVAFFLIPNVENEWIKDYYLITHFNVHKQYLPQLMAAISNSLFSIIPLQEMEMAQTIRHLVQQLLLQKFRLAQGEESILQKLDCEEWLTANDGLVYECVGNQRTEKQHAKEKKQAKSQKERTKVKKAKQRLPS